MTSLKDATVLVTGADGFIGSHLVERLAREGCRVRAFVLYNALGTQGWLDSVAEEVRSSIEVVSGDVRDEDCVRAAVKGCDLVFHLAALISIPYSYDAPRSYVETNVGGTLNVLLAARDCSARVIQTSTSEVYGTAQYVPMDEAHRLNAQSPYAATKIAADQLALSFHRSFGVAVTILRPFNTYGPRQSLRAVIPTTIVQLLEGRETLSLGNTQATRDFTFVEDTVSAFIALALAPGAVGEVVNAGSGFEVSIADVVAMIAKILDRPATIRREERRLRPAASEVDRLCASYAKLQRLTGWAPSTHDASGMTTGLARTIEWFREPTNRALYGGRDYAR